MSRWLAAFLCSLLPAPLAAQAAVTQGFPAASDAVIHVAVPTGKVRIETWDRDSITGKSGSTARNAHLVGSGGVNAKFSVESNDAKDAGTARADLTITVPTQQAHVSEFKMIQTATSRQRTPAASWKSSPGPGSITVEDAQGVVSVEDDRCGRIAHPRQWQGRRARRRWSRRAGSGPRHSGGCHRSWAARSILPASRWRRRAHRGRSAAR